MCFPFFYLKIIFERKIKVVLVAKIKSWKHEQLLEIVTEMLQNDYNV